MRRQVGWPLPLTGAAQEGGTGGGAGPFESADDALLAEVQRLILAMAALQRSADPESFAQVNCTLNPKSKSKTRATAPKSECCGYLACTARSQPEVLPLLLSSCGLSWLAPGTSLGVGSWLLY